MYGNVRYCQRCGTELTGLRRKWCPECAKMANSLWRMAPATRDAYLRRCRDSTIRRAEAAKRSGRKLTMEQVAALAKEYDSPYNSYGKLKAYIDRHDSLPPEEFRRGNRKRVDWQGWKQKVETKGDISV